MDKKTLLNIFNDFNFNIQFLDKFYNDNKIWLLNTYDGSSYCIDILIFKYRFQYNDFITKK